MSAVVQVANLSKHYRLGLIGGGTLREDVSRAIAKLRGKPDPLLTVNEFDLTARSQREIWALRDINFTVDQGEVLGIIGHNGAGKSTLLKILSKITAPTTGQIKLKGRVGSLLEVGTGFHPELTGRENIYLNGAILGMRREEVSKKLDQIVEFAEMARFIDTPVKRYSSGMSVRLAFSVAAHLEPEILIVDEVLAVGDLAFQKKCLGKMSDISSKGRTVLFVSHNMAAVENLCTRAIVLANGQLAHEGSTAEMIEAYRSANQTGDSLAKHHAHVDLSSIKRNNKSFAPLLKSITLGSGKSQDLLVPVGNPLNISIKLKNEVNLITNQIGLCFKNEFQETICHFTSEMINDPTQLGNASRLTAEIDSIPLIPGAYSVDIALFKRGVNVIDQINNALEFQIIDADFYGSGLSITKDFGKCLVSGTWSTG